MYSLNSKYFRQQTLQFQNKNYNEKLLECKGDMTILLKPIKNELDYDNALTRVDVFMEIPYIGNKSKVSEVLHKKVGLSLSMITNT